VDFVDRAEDAGLDQLDEPARPRVREALVAHLRRHFRRASCVGHPASLRHGVCEWLLAVHVLAEAHREERSRSVVVVGRRDGHGVDARAFLVEHLAVVLVPLRLREALVRLRGVRIVDVAERDDVLAGAVADVDRPFPPDADAGDVELLVAPESSRAQHGGEGGKAHGQCGGGAKESTAVNGARHEVPPKRAG
jgi:hypothetical protein